MEIKADLPDKLRFLFVPHRYKVARGGRGSAKSWSFARALLIKGVSEPLRIGCGREIQKSIKDSVHQLLKDQIQKLNLQSHYNVLENKIVGRNGTLFTFIGLASLTIETIKSLEGYDIFWVEEGQAVSKRSWRILIPTIRKDNSEIWITYNPDLESDETHQRFTVNRPPDCINIEMNWRDNPWFPPVLEKERQHCYKADPDNYDNIWEGKCRPAVEGAIYFKQIQEAENQKRIRPVPYDPMLKVHLVLDLGWEDSLGIGCVQKSASEMRIIEYVEAHQTKLNVFSDEMKSRGYNWGRVYLPHDGFSKRLESDGLSTADILSANGWDVVPREEIIEMSVEEGIRVTRMLMPQIYFDIDKTAATKAPKKANNPEFYHTDLSWRLIEVLKRYRRHINKQTEAAGAPVHDQYAHGADMLRYLCINAHKMTNDRPAERYIPPRNRRARRA